MNVCPPRDVWARLLADQLDPAAEERLEAHLVRCLTCRALLDALTPLLPRRSGLGGDEPAFEDVLRALDALAPWAAPSRR